MQEEIFGPVLAVCKVKSFDEGLAVFNNTIFGLTGGYFGKRRNHLEKVRVQAHCGNLYLNRKCTGALVGAPTLRRLQPKRHQQQGRRPRLPATLPARQKRHQTLLSLGPEFSKNNAPVRSLPGHCLSGGFARHTRLYYYLPGRNDPDPSVIHKVRMKTRYLRYGLIEPGAAPRHRHGLRLGKPFL